MTRHSYSGGIYGKPPKLQIIRPDGSSVTVEGNRAQRFHTRIMSVPKGEQRVKELESILKEIEP